MWISDQSPVADPGGKSGHGPTSSLAIDFAPPNEEFKVSSNTGQHSKLPPIRHMMWPPSRMSRSDTASHWPPEMQYQPFIEFNRLRCVTTITVLNAIIGIVGKQKTLDTRWLRNYCAIICRSSGWQLVITCLQVTHRNIRQSFRVAVPPISRTRNCRACWRWRRALPDMIVMLG